MINETHRDARVWAAPSGGAVRPMIDADCPRYVCRCCRTKTGWPHQIGCEQASVTKPDCGDCRYWNKKKNRCDHPAARKEREAR